jgi:hypothetical protein
MHENRYIERQNIAITFVATGSKTNPLKLRRKVASTIISKKKRFPSNEKMLSKNPKLSPD